MKIMQLQTDWIYGPVASRRLGRSLGINPLPVGRKTCTFDCIYCQYGRSRPAAAPTSSFPGIDEIARALDDTLKDVSVDYITFSGNGEPTLHPAFPELVEAVAAVRARRAPTALLAILSNSTTASDERIRRGLGLLDVRIMKLDAALEDVFREVNCPHAGRSAADVVEALAALGGCTVQTCFLGGEVNNCTDEAIDEYVEAIRLIKPTAVQVYTADRPCADRRVRVVPDVILDRVAQRIRDEAGVSAEVF